MDIILKILTALANVFAIIASGIAIYLFVAKREVISSALHVLLNYSSQITLAELKAKLERLNDLSVNDPNQINDVVNIFNEIIGQIRGNKILSKQFKEVISKVSDMVGDKRRLSEPKKRALVSELRERLRNIDVDNYADLIGE